MLIAHMVSDADNFEPLPVVTAALKTNKWAGEDEEEDVKVCAHGFQSGSGCAQGY